MGKYATTQIHRKRRSSSIGRERLCVRVKIIEIVRASPSANSVISHPRLVCLRHSSRPAARSPLCTVWESTLTVLDSIYSVYRRAEVGRSAHTRPNGPQHAPERRRRCLTCRDRNDRSPLSSVTWCACSAMTDVSHRCVCERAPSAP